MAGKIPATVVTGFLGAGKTTLIRHMMAHAGGRRIALVINEFGDLGVDGGILEGCGTPGCGPGDMVELSNGCICCTVAEDFVPAMQTLVEQEVAPDHIVIETSGLALPQPLVRAFNWPDVRTRVTVDGVVAVVDGPALAAGRFAADEGAVDARRAADAGLDHETPLSELFDDQLASADMVVLGKTDLLEPAARTELAGRLRAATRPGVSVVEAAHGAVDPGVLLGLGAGAEADIAARAEVHHPHDEAGHDEHDHDEFESFIVALDEIGDADRLAATIGEAVAAHDLLRVKGFAAVAGRPMRLVVQAVGPRVESHYDRPFDAGEARETRLVVIGQAGLDREAIAAALTP